MVIMRVLTLFLQFCAFVEAGNPYQIGGLPATNINGFCISDDGNTAVAASGGNGCIYYSINGGGFACNNYVNGMDWKG